MSMINFIYFPCKKASLNYKVILMDVQTEFVNQKFYSTYSKQTWLRF